MDRLGKMLLLATACLLLSAPLASAATRYAAPGGTGEDPCASLADPCSIYTAAQYDAPGTTIEAGDVVELAPGTYSEAAGDLGPADVVNSPAGVLVRGEPGKARPLIVLQTNEGGWGAFFVGPAVEVADVEIRNQAANGSAISLQGGEVERVVARSTVSAAFTCTMFKGTMRSSACINEAGGTAIGVSVVTAPGTYASVLRNSTFVATGPGSIGMDFAYFATEPGVVGAVNAIGVIAKGGAKDVVARGLALTGSGPGASTAIELQASNYATTDTKTSGTGSASVAAPGSNGNITDPPLLAADNLHQLPSSPTVDKGAVDGASASLDVDEHVREIGPAPDIGADELRNATETIVSCAGGSLLLGQSMPCTVTVVDTSASPFTPTGSVALSSGAGSVASSCALIAAGVSASNCAVNFTTTAAGTATLKAAYEGGLVHEPSSGELNVNVAVQPPSLPSQSLPGAETTSPPETRLTGKPSKKTTKRLARFTFSSDRPGSRFECKLDKKPFRGCSSPFRKKVVLGSHKFQVRAVDAQGGVDQTPAVFRWQVVRP